MRRWRGDDYAPQQPPSHSSNLRAMDVFSFAEPTLASAHVVELLAPLYAQIPLSGRDVAVFDVALQRTHDDWLCLGFPELGHPGKPVTMDVACVNHENGGCRCEFVRLLKSVVVLGERHVLRVTAKYVVFSGPHELSDGEIMNVATLQLFVALHERASRSEIGSLSDFDLVLSHLQLGSQAVKGLSSKHRKLTQVVENAKKSRCHVVGCELHPFETADQARFTLDDVFYRLTTHVEVEQMAIRDDATYATRMKKTRRDFILTDLPIPALHAFVRMLGARDLAAVSAVCSMFQHLAYEVVPGLKLVLYSHQRKGLRWLLYREGSGHRASTELPHPFVFPSRPRLQSSDANPQDMMSETNSIDLIECRLVKQSTVSPATDFRGGLFCDEPGLGKTITMLALILRTKGQRSDPRTLEDEEQTTQRVGMSLRSSGSRGRSLNARKLKPSATSLIVVPNPLLDHWRYQIATHVASGVLKVFVDDIDFKCDLPCLEELATYDVVITSFGRLTDEWKYRRPKSALEEHRPDRYGYDDGPDRFVDGFVNRGTSPLLMVHWVRIIVDEGHKLGGTNETYHMRMARLLHADKRWVMTGTPTPNTLQSADLRHMHGLLVFLRDRPYGEPDSKAWLKAIARPFEQKEQSGYVRLLHLLNRIMMRHTKESVRTLIPSPIRHVVLIDPTPREYAMYNGVAAAVRANLVITNKDPHTPGKLHLDSLLNPIHRRWAKQVTGNLRLATCGGGQIKATLTRESFAETINMLNDHGVEPQRIDKVVEFMRKAESIDVLSLCTLCGRHLQLLMLLPCGHMACADCVETRVDEFGPSCGICNTNYDWEIFQMLQPGFEFGNVEETWEYDNTPTPGTAQPNIRAASNGSSVNRQPQHRPRVRPNDGSTIPVRERDGNRQRVIPIDLSRFATVNASKAFYVASRITELQKDYARHDERDSDSYWSQSPPRPKVVKAIIFSQFKEHIWRVKVALAQQGIHCADFITGVSPAMRMQGLLKFRNDPNSNVLVLTDVGSHGLDLSFVTHIFLMDEIWDKSLEKQVVARAHRMGARHSVVVEQLLMRSSVEEIMHEMNRRGHNGEQPEEELEALDEYNEDDSRTVSSSHQPGSRVMRGFFAGENKLKHKRQRHRQAVNSKAGPQKVSQSKTSIQHRHLQNLLQSLRLIEENDVAEFGFVKFKVLDRDGELVRSASLRLPNPGKPPSTTGSNFTLVDPAQPIQSSRTVDSPTVVTTRVSLQSPSRPTTQVAVSTSSTHFSASEQFRTVKKVRVLFKESPPTNRSHGNNTPARPITINLTSDTDSASEDSVAGVSPHDHRSGGAASFRKAGQDKGEDSEVSNEWNAVKRETSRTTLKKPNGKAKARSVVFDDDADED